jgi:hypothetical protein
VIRGNLTRKLSTSNFKNSESETTDQENFTEDEYFGVSVDDVGTSAHGFSASVLTSDNAPTTPQSSSSIKYTKKYDARGMPLIQTNSRSGPTASAGNSPSAYGIGDDAPTRADSSPSHNTLPVHLSVGSAASIRGKDPVVTGLIRYVGLTQFASGYWVGIELNTPTGKNNGSVQGIVYFTCAPNYGLFVRPSQVIVANGGIYTDHNGRSSSSLTSTPSRSRQEQVHTFPGTHFNPQVAVQSNALSHTPVNKAKAVAKQRDDFTALVKTKIYELMTILNQQLDIVEQMER